MSVLQGTSRTPDTSRSRRRKTLLCCTSCSVNYFHPQRLGPKSSGQIYTAFTVVSSMRLTTRSWTSWFILLRIAAGLECRFMLSLTMSTSRLNSTRLHLRLPVFLTIRPPLHSRSGTDSRRRHQELRYGRARLDLTTADHLAAIILHYDGPIGQTHFGKTATVMLRLTYSNC